MKLKVFTLRLNPAKGIFDESELSNFQSDKDVIEAELGQPLDWRETPENRSSQIALHWGNVDITDRADWPRQHRWFLENLEALHRVFAPRIRALDSGTLEPPPEAPP